MDSKWRIVTVGEFFEKRQAAPKNPKLLLFITDRDVSAMPGLSTLKGAFSACSWLKAAATVQHGDSAAGVCGR